MNIKKAVIAGAVLWVLVFFEVSILMFGLKIEIPSTTYYLLHIPVFAALVALVSYFMYFKNEEEKGAKSGFALGLAMLAAGLVLDAVITVPLFVKDYSFFFRADMLVCYLEALIVITAVGAVKK